MSFKNFEILLNMLFFNFLDGWTNKIIFNNKFCIFCRTVRGFSRKISFEEPSLGFLTPSGNSRTGIVIQTSGSGLD